MKLSTKGRYAVMAMVELASRGDAKPTTLAEIAERQDISLSYLEQLFAKLRRAGIVRSVRGPGGGYVLAFPPRDTRISDIIIAVDEPVQVTICGKSWASKSACSWPRSRWRTSASAACWGAAVRFTATRSRPMPMPMATAPRRRPRLNEDHGLSRP
jgi:Rrf2 family iron-sulfur cluster assembly transcriptional regulator